MKRGLSRSTETALLTGASAGIGRELAKLFAADGSTLVLVARDEERLRALAGELRAAHGVDVHVLAQDLARPQAPEAIFGWAEERGIPVDVLVNNAGFGAGGPVAELDLGRQLDMVQVNVVALTHLTRLFLPGMLERRRGAILNVASTAGFQPGPYMAVYYASKAYVLHFTEALAEELRGSGVTASALAPGATATEFFARAGLERSWLTRTGMMDARAVAEAGYVGMRRGEPLIVPGLKNKATAIAGRVLPRTLVRRAVRVIQGR